MGTPAPHTPNPSMDPSDTLGVLDRAVADESLVLSGVSGDARFAAEVPAELPPITHPPTEQTSP